MDCATLRSMRIVDDTDRKILLELTRHPRITNAAIAEQLGLVPENCLPRPIRGPDAGARSMVRSIVDELRLS